jgi:hypothetical protein
MFGVVEEWNGLELNKSDVDSEENKSTARACLPIEGLFECRRCLLFYRKRLGRFQKCERSLSRGSWIPRRLFTRSTNMKLNTYLCNVLTRNISKGLLSTFNNRNHIQKIHLQIGPPLPVLYQVQSYWVAGKGNSVSFPDGFGTFLL